MSKYINFKFKLIQRVLFILSIFLITNIDCSIQDILIFFLMFIGLILEFIQTEKSNRELISIFSYWFIIINIIFYWKKVYLYNLPLLQLELIKLTIISFVGFKFKNNIQNSIFTKLSLITLVLYLSEITLNSTFSFFIIYFPSVVLLILYSIINAYNLRSS